MGDREFTPKPDSGAEPASPATSEPNIGQSNNQSGTSTTLENASAPPISKLNNNTNNQNQNSQSNTGNNTSSSSSQTSSTSSSANSGNSSTTGTGTNTNLPGSAPAQVVPTESKSTSNVYEEVKSKRNNDSGEVPSKAGEVKPVSAKTAPKREERSEEVKSTIPEKPTPSSKDQTPQNQHAQSPFEPKTANPFEGAKVPQKGYRNETSSAKESPVTEKSSESAPKNLKGELAADKPQTHSSSQATEKISKPEISSYTKENPIQGSKAVTGEIISTPLKTDNKQNPAQTSSQAPIPSKSGAEIIKAPNDTKNLKSETNQPVSQEPNTLAKGQIVKNDTSPKVFEKKEIIDQKQQVTSKQTDPAVEPPKKAAKSENISTQTEQKISVHPRQDPQIKQEKSSIEERAQKVDRKQKQDFEAFTIPADKTQKVVKAESNQTSKSRADDKVIAEQPKSRREAISDQPLVKAPAEKIRNLESLKERILSDINRASQSEQLRRVDSNIKEAIRELSSADKSFSLKEIKEEATLQKLRSRLLSLLLGEKDTPQKIITPTLSSKDGIAVVRSSGSSKDAEAKLPIVAVMRVIEQASTAVNLAVKVLQGIESVESRRSLPPEALTQIKGIIQDLIRSTLPMGSDPEAITPERIEQLRSRILQLLAQAKEELMTLDASGEALEDLIEVLEDLNQLEILEEQLLEELLALEGPQDFEEVLLEERVEIFKELPEKEEDEVEEVFAVSGQVLHRDSGKPMSNLVVYGGLLGTCLTDELGEFIFQNIPSGTFITLGLDPELKSDPAVFQGVIEAHTVVAFKVIPNQIPNLLNLQD